MVVSTVLVRMGEGAYGDGLPVSGLAIDGRTDEVSATDCGVRAEMVVSTAVVRMGEGARGREREEWTRLTGHHVTLGVIGTISRVSD